MAAQDLSAQEIQNLVDTRHPVVGIEFPTRGLQPYYDWLLRTLAHLADASFGAFRVAPDDSAPLAFRVAPGRATIDSALAVLTDAATIDLAPFNNQTALVWIVEQSGDAVPQAGAASSGWPAGAHLKLAEVTLQNGVPTQTIDRRLDTVFQA
ncbi:MAG: hypothetical protein AAF288_03190 [Planctomycetota bacterium]